MSRATLLRLSSVGLLCAFALLGWRKFGHQPEAPATLRQTPLRVEAVASETEPEAAPTDAELTAQARDLFDALLRLARDRDRRAREALLTFKDDEALRRFLERAAKTGLTVIDRIDGLLAVRVGYDSLNSLRDEILQHADDYSEIAANSLMRIPSAPAPENRALQHQVPFGNDTLAFLGADGDRSDWGRGVTIAILDTGMSADPTFGTRARPLDIGRGIAPGKGEADGHGTSVAALAAGMAADAAGVAPAAELLSIRVTDENGVSDVFTIARAIIAAVDAGARVVNISLGGHSTSGTLSSAIAYATNHGAVIVAAAGNDQAAQLAWPAADARVVSVGAVDKAEQQVMFSNSGPQLKLTAPGYGVQTAWLGGQRAYVDGTSASAPLVSGAIAAVISRNPSLTPVQAAELLMITANDAGAPGADPAFGGGILNLGWTMNRATPGYVDTAVSSHFYDAESQEMQFVVQNRSSQPVTGLHLDVAANNTSRRYTVPTLNAGESYVVRTPVNATSLRAGQTLRFTTHVSSPAGVADRVPTNNRRSSVVTAPTP